ncbi:hypothetical protein ACFZAK_11440 [Streptomyces albidoflavus]
MPDLPAPSSTGVRIAGDRYQWLAAWQGCVAAVRDAALRAPNPVVGVGVEVDDAGNLDDVVLYRQAPPHTYMQVKYAADSSTPVNEEYLLKPSDRGSPSILRKMAQAWQQLTKDGTPVDLALLSNRSPDAEDPLVSLRDSRTQLLVPKAAQQGPKSKKGQARTRWADGAGLSEEMLWRVSDLQRAGLLWSGVSSLGVGLGTAEAVALGRGGRGLGRVRFGCSGAWPTVRYLCGIDLGFLVGVVVRL